MNDFALFYFSTIQNISIAIVGKDQKFRILNDEETSFYVSAVEKRTGPGGSGGSGGDASVAPAPPADDPTDDRPGEQGPVAMEA